MWQSGLPIEEDRFPMRPRLDLLRCDASRKLAEAKNPNFVRT
jgi:hypothetical protein